MKITVSSTEEWFSTGQFPVRAWKGETETGGEVIAFIAGLQLDAGEEIPGMRPIPPPVHAWSPAQTEAASEIWLLMQRLSDKEAAELHAWARSRAAFRESGMVEQHCERCEQPYRGPSMYCCHDCAIADATS